MESIKLVRSVFIPFSLLALAACGAASSQARPDDGRGLVAMGAPVATDSPVTERAEPVLAQLTAPIPEEVLRDPAERFALIEQLRTQVVYRTRAVPDARWRAQVRPAVRRQLEGAGLPRGDVDFLLWEVDQSKRASVK